MKLPLATLMGLSVALARAAPVAVPASDSDPVSALVEKLTGTLTDTLTDTLSGLLPKRDENLGLVDDYHHDSLLDILKRCVGQCAVNNNADREGLVGGW